MRQIAIALAGATLITESYWAAISQGAFLGLPLAFKGSRNRASFDMPALAPIEVFVDWLEAAYGGPIGPDTSFSRH